MHLTSSEDMAGMALKDWPMAQGLVIISGLALIAGGIGVLIGKMGKWASIGLAVLMLLFIVMLHMPNVMGGNEQMQQMGMISTLKDLGLMGGALFFAWHFDQKEA